VEAIYEVMLMMKGKGKSGKELLVEHRRVPTRLPLLLFRENEYS
jgi:hypothetical protein